MDANADHEAHNCFMECNQTSNEAQFLVNALPNVKVILLDLNRAADGFLRHVKSSSPLRVFVRDRGRDEESAVEFASRVQAFALIREVRDPGHGRGRRGDGTTAASLVII
ncbi:hypothetical protein K438DRAFT_1771322 [Mycena galopus ATCC 62051]|nr:hypothetical protein K438DRAFT_1771322 [Mycena galopus ATCC 62051]